MLSTLLALLILISPLTPVNAEATTVPIKPIKDTVSITPIIPDRIDNTAVVVISEKERLAGEAIKETVKQGLCVEWITTALSAGWEYQDLPRLMRVMHRESRCIPTVCAETDSPRVRKCRDWGLMQINDYSWKTTIRSLGLDIEQMHDPYWNLWFARWLFEYSLERNGDGWRPWKPVKQNK